MLERGSGSLGFASWAHNLSARMEPFEGQRGCPNQTDLLIGHKAIYPDCTIMMVLLSWANSIRITGRITRYNLVDVLILTPNRS